MKLSQNNFVKVSILFYIVLTIGVTNILSARNAPTDPARRRHLRHQVLRVLDVLLDRRDQRRILLVKRLLRDCAALLALTHLLRVEQQALNIGIATTCAHIRDRHERSRLATNDAAIVLELRLISQNRVSINGLVVEAKALLRVDHELLDTQRVDLSRIRHKITHSI